MDLTKLVKAKIDELGVKEASKFFGVSAGTVSNWSSGTTAPSITAAQLVLSEIDLDDEDAPTHKKQEKEPCLPPLELWQGKDVIILLPVYRSFSPDTHFTLFANYAKYGSDKIGMIQEKRTLIYESRNILAAKFLKTGATWALMADDDMILPCGNKELFNGRYRAGVNEKSASFNAISRIMSHPADCKIVGSLYFGRHDEGKAQCASGFTSEMENRKLHLMEYTGLKQEEWVGTGFIRIHRDVFLAMKDEIDKGRWPDCKPKDEGSWYGFFNPLRVGIGEDVSFCRRAREIGIQTYLDTELICLHNGERNFGPTNTKY